MWRRSGIRLAGYRVYRYLNGPVLHGPVLHGPVLHAPSDLFLESVFAPGNSAKFGTEPVVREVYICPSAPAPWCAVWRPRRRASWPRRAKRKRILMKVTTGLTTGSHAKPARKRAAPGEQ